MAKHPENPAYCVFRINYKTQFYGHDISHGTYRTQEMAMEKLKEITTNENNIEWVEASIKDIKYNDVDAKFDAISITKCFINTGFEVPIYGMRQKLIEGVYTYNVVIQSTDRVTNRIEFLMAENTMFEWIEQAKEFVNKKINMNDAISVKTHKHNNINYVVTVPISEKKYLIYQINQTNAERVLLYSYN